MSTSGRLGAGPGVELATQAGIVPGADVARDVPLPPGPVVLAEATGDSREPLRAPAVEIVRVDEGFEPLEKEGMVAGVGLRKIRSQSEEDEMR